MVSADDNVRAAIILANQTMPHRLARSAHAHRQREQRKLYGSMRIFRQQELVAANARVVIHVARFRHPNYWMQQQARFHVLRGTHGKLHVSAMHWVSSLERNDFLPTESRKLSSQLR